MTPTNEQPDYAKEVAANHAARIGHGFVVVGSTEAIMEFLELSPQHNEHCKGYRWFQYMADSKKRMENVREEARKIIDARMGQ